MKNQETPFIHSLKLRVYKLLNLIEITVPFALCWYLFYANLTATPYYWKGKLTVALLFLFLFGTMARVYDAQQVSLQRIGELVGGQVLAFLITDGVLYIVICLLAKKMCNLWPGIACIAAQTVIAVLWCLTTHQWYFRSYAGQKTAIIYETREGMEELIAEYGMEKKFDIQYTAQVQDCLQDLSALNGMQTVFLSGVHSHDRNIILKHCVEQGVTCYIIPRIGDVIMAGAKRMHMFHLPMLRVGRYNPHPEYLLMKRAGDILASLIALIIASPFMLVTAIAIKAYDGGPALYKQVRLTKDGKEFKILKFRSMRVDAEANGVARLSTGENDDRITPVGKIIRKIRFDELPQLINILKGENSIFVTTPNKSTKCCFA